MSVDNEKLWHTPIKAYSDYLGEVKKHGVEMVMKLGKFQKVRETRALAVLCFAMYKSMGTPWFLQLDQSEVTDGRIMRMSPKNQGDLELLRVEHTAYVRRNDGMKPSNSLLDQLKASKTFESHHKYDEHTLIMIDLGNGFDETTGVDFNAIADYLRSIDAPYQLWALEQVEHDNPDTIVQVTLCTPEVGQLRLNVGEAWHEQFEKNIRGTLVATQTADVEKAGKITPNENPITRAVWDFEG